MVRDYHKKSYTSASTRYRAPKTYGVAKARERKKIEVPNWVFRWTIITLAILGLLYYLFFSDQFRIRDIIVEGNNLLPKEDIVGVIQPNQNIFLFKIDQTRNSLKTKFPEIKQVEVYRGIPNALKVVILERDGKIVWQSGNDKYLVSSQGEVAKKVTGSEGDNLPVVVDMKNLPVAPGKQLVSPNFIAFIMNVYNNFYTEVNIKPLNFEINETTFNVNLKTDAGFYVKLNSLRSSKTQLQNLKLILMSKRSQIHEYVDLRIDGWAYYK